MFGAVSQVVSVETVSVTNKSVQSVSEDMRALARELCDFG